MRTGRKITCEVCVDTATGALAAAEGGADRVELCSNLLEGGTTPSAGAVRWVRDRLDIGVMVLVRPRGGDFVYDADETEVMIDDIEALREIGVDGVVIGALRTDGHLDIERIGVLVAAARPLQVTFHRAFDMCIDPRAALEQLVSLGVERILTSGQEDAAADGLGLITELVGAAGDRISIMPGGGIGEGDIRRIVDSCGAHEVHFAAGAIRPSPMVFRNPGCSMGCGDIPGEYERCFTDTERVRKFIQAANTPTTN